MLFLLGSVAIIIKGDTGIKEKFLYVSNFILHSC